MGDEVNRFGNENREKLVRDGYPTKKRGRKLDPGCDDRMIPSGMIGRRKKYIKIKNKKGNTGNPSGTCKQYILYWYCIMHENFALTPCAFTPH